MKTSGSMDACLRAREVFVEALDQPDAPARARCVAAACADDPRLRQEVERLLEDHFAADGFMAAPARGELPALLPAEAPGSVIGRYKLLERLGEGGMGVVFMAEQREPVARRVALKVIKLGLDTRSVIARFEAERQALALMDHPHIAKVLDAGATESGRPYFVMELVQGVPLTDFCARNQLTIAERLRLFLPVCHAVRHAHQKGVIHRDLKPSNILVTQSHGAPHPLIIDFGVAKATQQRLTEKTLFTNFGTMIGTPAYMSPEQAELGREDVDTRSDLYSLGVRLYELLSNATNEQHIPIEIAGLAPIELTPTQHADLAARIQGLEASLPARTAELRWFGHRAIGQRRLRTGELQRSLENLDRAETAQPSPDIGTLYLKALCLSRMNRRAEALAALHEADRLTDAEIPSGPESEAFLHPSQLYQAILLRREAHAELGDP